MIIIIIYLSAYISSIICEVGFFSLPNLPKCAYILQVSHPISPQFLPLLLILPNRYVNSTQITAEQTLKQYIYRYI